MKYNIVFFYKMDKGTVIPWPVVFPVFVMIWPTVWWPKCLIIGASIHIQFFALMSQWRDGILLPSPITCHCPGLKASFNPGFAWPKTWFFQSSGSWVWTPSTTPVLIHSLQPRFVFIQGKYQCLVDFNIETRTIRYRPGFLRSVGLRLVPQDSLWSP